MLLFGVAKIFLLEGIARAYRQAPTVSAVLKQMHSPARGIKPWALNVRVGLNCAVLLKIHLEHPYLFVFIYLAPTDCPRCLQLDQVHVGRKKERTKFCLLFTEVVHNRHLAAFEV